MFQNSLQRELIKSPFFIGSSSSTLLSTLWWLRAITFSAHHQEQLIVCIHKMAPPPPFFQQYCGRMQKYSLSHATQSCEAFSFQMPALRAKMPDVNLLHFLVQNFIPKFIFFQINDLVHSKSFSIFNKLAILHCILVFLMILTQKKNNMYVSLFFIISLSFDNISITQPEFDSTPHCNVPRSTINENYDHHQIELFIEGE